MDSPSLLDCVAADAAAQVDWECKGGYADSSFVLCVCRDFMKESKVFRHLVDSGAHGAVAFCCWGVFLCQTGSRCSSPHASMLPTSSSFLDRNGDTTSEVSAHSSSQPRLLFLKRCVLAGIAASLLDLDHFIAAGSFSISGATHLKVNDIWIYLHTHLCANWHACIAAADRMHRRDCLVAPPIRSCSDVHRRRGVACMDILDQDQMST